MKTLVVVLSLFIGNALACSCGQWGTAREILADADSVFVGKLIRSRIGGISPETGSPLVASSFSVLRSYKPQGLNMKTVLSEKGDGANCGTQFQKGVSYLILGFTVRGRTYTDFCSYKLVNNSRSMRALLAELQAASSL